MSVHVGVCGCVCVRVCWHAANINSLAEFLDEGSRRHSFQRYLVEFSLWLRETRSDNVSLFQLSIHSLVSLLARRRRRGPVIAKTTGFIVVIQLTRTQRIADEHEARLDGAAAGADVDCSEELDGAGEELSTFTQVLWFSTIMYVLVLCLKLLSTSLYELVCLSFSWVRVSFLYSSLVCQNLCFSPNYWYNKQIKKCATLVISKVTSN